MSFFSRIVLKNTCNTLINRSKHCRDGGGYTRVEGIPTGIQYTDEKGLINGVVVAR